MAQDKGKPNLSSDPNKDPNKPITFDHGEPAEAPAVEEESTTVEDSTTETKSARRSTQ